MIGLWDKIYLFTPYTTQEDIDKELGSRVTFNDPDGLYLRDDISLLVFIENNRMIEYAEVNSRPAALTIKGRKYLTRSDAVISLVL